MAKRRASCRVGEKRFTVVQVNGDPADSHAGRSFQHAYAAASPDRGSRVKVFVTCAGDPGEARLPSNYMKRGVLVSSRRAKR